MLQSMWLQRVGHDWVTEQQQNRTTVINVTSEYDLFLRISYCVVLSLCVMA